MKKRYVYPLRTNFSPFEDGNKEVLIIYVFNVTLIDHVKLIAMKFVWYISRYSQKKINISLLYWMRCENSQILCLIFLVVKKNFFFFFLFYCIKNKIVQSRLNHISKIELLIKRFLQWSWPSLDRKKKKKKTKKLRTITSDKKAGLWICL